MAISNKFSFTVRSILDLPENDTESMAHHSPVEAFSVSPYSSWTENGRGHTSSDESNLEASPDSTGPDVPSVDTEHEKRKRQRMDSS